MENHNKLYLIIAYILSWVLPKRRCVYFSSFYGQYNDNPKQISETLHEMDSSIPILWTKSRRNNVDFPDYVSTVDITSFKHYIMMYVSMVTVDNQLGIRTVFASRKNILKRWICNLLTKKYKRQLNIGTWHGTPLKKVGQDINGGYANYKLYSTIDYMIAGCNHTKNCLHSAFPNENVKLYGTPRNDIFFKSYDIDEIKGKLKLPKDKKVLLFAPTFRNNIENSGPKQLKEIDWKRVCYLLSRKLGGNWIVAIRIHPHVKEYIKKIEFSDILVDGNYGDDMADYLLVADCLITDYSSSFFDYSLSYKPCFLYAPDLESYRDKERDLYLNFDELPFPISKKPSTLYESIENFNTKDYILHLSQFLEKIGNSEDGKASERVASDIIYFLSKQN